MRFISDSSGPRPRNPVFVSLRTRGKPVRGRRHDDLALRQTSADRLDGQEDGVAALAPAIERLVDRDRGDMCQSTPVFAQPQFPRLVDGQDADLQRTADVNDIELTAHEEPPGKKRSTPAAVASGGRNFNMGANESRLRGWAATLGGLNPLVQGLRLCRVVKAGSAQRLQCPLPTV